jgi:hypothetical protein
MRLVSVLLIVILSALLPAVSYGDESFTGSGRKGKTAGYRYTLTLFDHGRAKMSTVRSSRSRKTATATWDNDKANQQLILQFIDSRGRPRGQPTIWKTTGRHLEALSWNAADWSGEAAPDLHR